MTNLTGGARKNWKTIFKRARLATCRNWRGAHIIFRPSPTPLPLSESYAAASFIKKTQAPRRKGITDNGIHESYGYPDPVFISDRGICPDGGYRAYPSSGIA